VPVGPQERMCVGQVCSRTKPSPLSWRLATPMVGLGCYIHLIRMCGFRALHLALLFLGSSAGQACPVDYWLERWLCDLRFREIIY
jgi:hypothetical protein